MTLADRLRELARYRGLVYSLTARDLKLKYKSSLLGVGWSLLNPLVMMAIYVGVFSLILRFNVPFYWALVLCSVLAWTFFSGSLLASVTAFVRNPSLISKIYFPIESLPISATLAQFINYLIPLALFLVLVAIRHAPLGAPLLLLPVILVLLLTFTLGMGILLAALTVYFRDVEHLTVIGLTAWFYISPVIYPLRADYLPAKAQPFLAIAWLNPMAWYLESLHSVIVYGRWPAPWVIFAMFAGAAVAMGLAVAVFNALRPRIPEEV